jgi:hypothetical protein
VEQVDRRLGGKLKDIRAFIDAAYDYDLHAKRVDSLAAATLGIMTGASLAVALIGQGLALARGLVTKHAIKQIDRLLSNQKVDVWESFAFWVPYLVGARAEIVVAMDWTDFDRDGQSTLVLSLVTRHGRATPLLWLTVWKEELTGGRNDFEDACLLRLSQVLPPGVSVTILADRGFGDHKLFAFLKELGFGYVIRFRGNIHVADAAGESRPAAEWVGKGGRARKLRDAKITTAEGYQVGTVVCVYAKGMKEPWCLAASDADATAAEVIHHHAKRWTIDIDHISAIPRTYASAWGSTPFASASPPAETACSSSMPSPSSSSRCSAAPVKASAWIGCSSPTPPRPERIRSSAKAACSTNSSRQCPRSGYRHSWRASPKPFPSAVHLMACFQLYNMRGSLSTPQEETLIFYLRAR